MDPHSLAGAVSCPSSAVMAGWLGTDDGWLDRPTTQQNLAQLELLSMWRLLFYINPTMLVKSNPISQKLFMVMIFTVAECAVHVLHSNCFHMHKGSTDVIEQSKSHRRRIHRWFTLNNLQCEKFFFCLSILGHCRNMAIQNGPTEEDALANSKVVKTGFLFSGDYTLIIHNY